MIILILNLSLGPSQDTDLDFVERCKVNINFNKIAIIL